MAEETDRIIGLEIGADDYLASRSTRANCWPASRRCCAACNSLPPQRDS